jgi:hypothetical protein
LSKRLSTRGKAGETGRTEDLTECETGRLRHVSVHQHPTF